MNTARIIYIAIGVIYLLSLAVWCIIKHMIIHYKKRICKHESVCLCSRDWCFKCDGHKEVVRPETERAETSCRKVEDNCIIVCEKNGEEK